MFGAFYVYVQFFVTGETVEFLNMDYFVHCPSKIDNVQSNYYACGNTQSSKILILSM